MSRKPPLVEGETCRVACVQVVLRRAVEEETGEVLAATALATRVGWAVDLAVGMAAGVLAQRWNALDVGVLASNVGPDGRALPSNAWMALRRLSWGATVPDGVKVNDRIVRMAQEQAGRTLREVQHRSGLVAGILATWPADPGKRTRAEWDAVRAAVPDGMGLPASVVKARTRQIQAFLAKHRRLPADVFELEGPPRAARMLILAACDAQQATIQRAEDDAARALLRLQLPTRPDPRSYADWTWVACPLVLPRTVPARAVLHLPTLRPQGTRVRADLSFTHTVPAAKRKGHTVALGCDWGLNTLLSAGACKLHSDGTITALGSGAMFRAAGVLDKQHRLRRQSEHLHARLDQHERLDPRLGDDAHQDACETAFGHVANLRTNRETEYLAARHTRLTAEKRRASTKRSNLNSTLAKQAARWAVDQALTAGATVIYLEDLRSMEAKGQGRTHNTRMSQTVRGQVVTWLRHLAAEHGIAVVTVPARNTSRHCPGCLVPLRHCAAPDRPNDAGWKWARCPNPDCGWQGDRDMGAWRRIAARGLTHQAKTLTDRTAGALTIRSVVDHLEARAVITATATAPVGMRRSKTRPTPPRNKFRSKPDRQSATTRPAPRRRGAPSPSRHPGTHPAGQAGQRPEGHAPKGPTATPGHLPRAAQRNQDVTAISTPTTRRRHRPRGAALGAGFHLHAHATPPRWADPPVTTPNVATDPRTDQRRSCSRSWQKEFRPSHSSTR